MNGSSIPCLGKWYSLSQARVVAKTNRVDKPALNSQFGASCFFGKMGTGRFKKQMSRNDNYSHGSTKPSVSDDCRPDL
jgi:hypothetical protein